MDPITIGLQLGFFVLFGVSVFQFSRHRGPLELSVVAIFGSFAALFRVDGTRKPLTLRTYWRAAASTSPVVAASS